MEVFVEHEIDWDQLSASGNESFFDRSHSDHEPLQKALLKSRFNRQMDKENTKGRIGRSTEKKEKNSKPVATVKPRGKSLPRSAPVPVAVPSTKKFTATVPVTPNVLKKRRAVRMTKVQPEQFVFKAKPAPAFHKSTGSLQQVTAKISKMQIGTGTSTATKREEKEKAKTTLKPTTAAPPFTARAPRREQRSTGPARVRVRSKSVPSVPHHQATIPVTPMVLKRNFRRTNPGHGQERQEVGFKAKPAEVLHRQPFKPKLPCNSQNNQNQSTCSTQSTTKAFDLCLEDRLKDRKLFNHRATDALEKRQKQVEDDKKRLQDEKYAAARLMTNFRATRNPFK